MTAGIWVLVKIPLRIRGRWEMISCDYLNVTLTRTASHHTQCKTTFILIVICNLSVPGQNARWIWCQKQQVCCVCLANLCASQFAYYKMWTRNTREKCDPKPNAFSVCLFMMCLSYSNDTQNSWMPKVCRIVWRQNVWLCWSFKMGHEFDFFCNAHVYRIIIAILLCVYLSTGGSKFECVYGESELING